MCKVQIAITFLVVVCIHVWMGEAKWTKLNQIPVCFEGRGNRPGQFMYVGKGVVLGALKLTWKSGNIRCVSDEAYNSLWGCYQYSSFKQYPFNVIVTDGKDKVIYPLPQFIKQTSGLWYYLPALDPKHSNSIVFSDFDTPLYLHYLMQLKLWYGEDLKNWSETDNQGRVCVDLFGFVIESGSKGNSSSGGGAGGSQSKALILLADLKEAFNKVLSNKY